MQAVTDEQLIRWVAAGDNSCLGALFERHHRDVYRYCLQLTRSAPVSEDLVQEIFVKLLRNAHSFRGDGSCKAWIYSIARNVTFDHLRGMERQDEVDNDAYDFNERLIDHCSTEQVVAGKQNLHLVQQALSKISTDALEVIWLGRFVFEDYEELGRALGCTANTARVRMHRAVQELKATFIRMNGAEIDV